MPDTIEFKTVRAIENGLLRMDFQAWAFGAVLTGRGDQTEIAFLRAFYGYVDAVVARQRIGLSNSPAQDRIAMHAEAIQKAIENLPPI